jgi:hypothetical protein
LLLVIHIIRECAATFTQPGLQLRIV